MTAGESHGKGMMAVLDGVPAGLDMDEVFINGELARRMTGYGRGKRMNIEKDRIEVIAGCKANRTIGSPVGLLIHNRDYRIEELPEVTSPRPGHADLAGMQKYDFRDARNVLERASARETAARVAAGAVAKLILNEFAVRILSHVVMIGKVRADTKGLSFDELLALAEGSDVRSADKRAAGRMREEIDKAAKAGDTLGGVFEVITEGVPPGLGSYAQWDRRLDGALARSVMSIQAVKAVSIGEGIEAAGMSGARTHDAIYYDEAKESFKRATNNAGGLEGGVTNGSAVVVRGFMKPIATLGSPLRSVDINTKKESAAATERSDITAVPACAVVAEAVVAFEIASAFLEKFGGDSMGETRRNFEAYGRHLKETGLS